MCSDPQIGVRAWNGGTEVEEHVTKCCSQSPMVRYRLWEHIEESKGWS